LLYNKVGLNQIGVDRKYRKPEGRLSLAVLNNYLLFLNLIIVAQKLTSLVMNYGRKKGKEKNRDLSSLHRNLPAL